MRIENLPAELRRVRKVLDQGLVTSPTNGRVTRISKFAGEYADATAPVIELLVDGSTEIVLYLPQNRSLEWSIGDHMRVSVDPTSRQLDCEVMRLAPGMQHAPNSIERYYDSGESLLPIIVRPSDPYAAHKLVLGSKVRLPRESTAWHLKDLTAWLTSPNEFDADGLSTDDYDQLSTATASNIDTEQRPVAKIARVSRDHQTDFAGRSRPDTSNDSPAKTLETEPVVPPTESQNSPTKRDTAPVLPSSPVNSSCPPDYSFIAPKERSELISILLTSQPELPTKCQLSAFDVQPKNPSCSDDQAPYGPESFVFNPVASSRGDPPS